MANPGLSAQLLLAQALELHCSGRLSEAEALYQSVVQRDPRCHEALHLLGILQAQNGRAQDGLASLDRAIALAPRVADYHSNRGNVLRELGKLPDSLHAYEQAIALDRTNAEYRLNLAMALRELGRKDEAVKSAREAVKLRPDWPIAHGSLGNALRDVGRLDEAIASHLTAAKLSPDSAPILSNLAIALSDVGRHHEAIELLERATKIDPNLATAYINLSDVLREVGRLGDSAAAAARATELQPNSADARVNLANALMQQGRVDDAIRQYMAAVRQKPDMHEAVSNALYVVHNRVVDRKWLFDEHCRWGKVFAPASVRKPVHNNLRDPAKKLRIGYVSADFRNHAVGRLILPVLESHDRQNFELTCYSQGHESDDQTAHIRNAIEHWQPTAGLSDDALADKIRADGIDILVDLAGHTAGNRLLAFARKPAPIQITWLGYPDTTGMEAMDYRIVDAITDPPGDADRLNAERLIRLDPCFLCLRLDVALLPELAQAKRPFTFGCFNNFSKASPQVMQMWARVLSNIPEARLMLRSRGLNYPGTVEFVTDALRAQSIPLNRVEIRSHVEFGEHLEAYNEIDIALDSFPYSGTATTSDALSMGVPVITLAGNTHVSRVSASLLNAAGIQDWIADTSEEYIAKARLAAAAGRRTRHQRETLRNQLKSSALCDEKSFTRKLESAYRQIWQVWCAQPPSA